jgi:hypothetical protein
VLGFNSFRFRRLGCMGVVDCVSMIEAPINSRATTRQTSNQTSPVIDKILANVLDISA